MTVQEMNERLNAARWHVATSSGNLSRFTYLKDLELLLIEFLDGHMYAYARVPEALYQGLRLAESKGKYAHKYIYNQHWAEKVFEPKQAAKPLDLELILRMSIKELTHVG